MDAGEIVLVVAQQPEEPDGFQDPRTLSDFSVRPDGEDAGNRPDVLLADPKDTLARVLGVAQIVDIGRGEQGLLGRADFLNEIVPDIGDVLLGDEGAGRGDGFILRTGDALADGSGGPLGWKLVGKFIGDQVD